MLVLSNVCKRFGTRTILDLVDLQIGTGEYVAIVGESGSGKSTLLNLIAGLDVPDTGRIEIDGQSLTTLTEDARTRLRRNRVGFVFQAFHILPHLTVAQNVELPLVLLGIDEDERATRVRGMISAVGLAGREPSLPRDLSGGELQRVALARAPVHRPALVLADEPTGNLDPDTADTVLSLLASTIRARGAAGVLVTHSPHAAQTADRILRLEHGRLVTAR
jgi:putative ABC transport system ATP-binding protein